MYTPTNPDDAELIKLESDGTPEWVYTGPNVHNINILFYHFFYRCKWLRNVMVMLWLQHFLMIKPFHSRWPNGPQMEPPRIQIGSFHCPVCILLNVTFCIATFPTETTVAISKDGKKMAVLTSLLEFMNPNNTRLYLFDTSSSKIQQVVEQTFYARHVVLSADGSLIAFHANSSIFVYNANTKQFVWNMNVGYSDFNLALSDDGKTLVTGFMSLDVYQWSDTAKTYQLSWSNALPNYYVETATIANGRIFVGWCAFDALQPAVQVYNANSASPLWTFTYPQSDNLQDTPWSISATNDGNYFVVGTWGSLNATNPEIRVWKATSDKPIYELSAGGSVFAVDIAAGNTLGSINVVAGAKATHANCT